MRGASINQSGQQQVPEVFKDYEAAASSWCSPVRVAPLNSAFFKEMCTSSRPPAECEKLIIHAMPECSLDQESIVTDSQKALRKKVY